MAVNFRELLSVPTDTVERPKPLPIGHYYATVLNHEFGESRNKKTPYVRFFFRPDEPGEDVPANEINGVDLTRRELRRDFFITPNALYRLSDFLDAVLGKETGRTFDERIPDTRSAKVLLQVEQRPDETDKDLIWNDVTDCIAA